MLSKEEVLEQYGKLETSIDNRFGSRLANFLTVEELGKIGITVKDEFRDSWEVNKEWAEENIIKQLISDAEFGLEKAENQRGISSALMTEVCEAWLVVLEDDSIKSDDIEYNYHFFRKILEKYGD